MRWGVSIKPKPKYVQETKAEALDKVLKEVDPVMVAGAMAAGIAGACGFKGPLTTILTGISGSNVQGQLANPAVAGFSTFTIGILPTLLAGLLSGKGNTDTPPPSEEDKAALGAAMANIVEFLITYAAATNPGTPAALAEMVKTLGSNLSGLAGLLPK